MVLVLCTLSDNVYICTKFCENICKGLGVIVFGLYFHCERTGLHKGVFVVAEYFNNIFGTNSHI